MYGTAGLHVGCAEYLLLHLSMMPRFGALQCELNVSYRMWHSCLPSYTYTIACYIEPSDDHERGLGSNTTRALGQDLGQKLANTVSMEEYGLYAVLVRNLSPLLYRLVR